MLGLRSLIECAQDTVLGLTCLIVYGLVIVIVTIGVVPHRGVTKYKSLSTDL